MKIASRILLYMCGAFTLISLLLTIIEFVISLLVVSINVGYNLIIFLAVVLNADRDLINTLVSFLFIKDPLYALAVALGMYSFSDGFLIGYTLVNSFLMIVYFIIAVILTIVPFIVYTITTIFCLVGAGKKRNVGMHVMDIVVGIIFIYYIANEFLGIGMILGGIFGLISDKKLKQQQELKRVDGRQVLAYNY